MTLDPVQFTERLVSLDTVSARSNVAVVGVLAEELTRLGAEVQWQPKSGDATQVNLLARLGPRLGARSGLALAGHTDTVPFDQSMRATDRPERDGRRLFGRGTCDMKGGIAAMICAAEQVDRSALRKPLWFAFTFQEEIGCLGAKHLLRELPLPVEHCIIGEPTGLRPVTRHKGYVIAHLRFRGLPCHSSDPDQGVSAIVGGARAVDALSALALRWQAEAPAAHGLLPPYPTLNVGLFDGGAARNMVAEHARFVVEVRPLPGQDPEALLDAVEHAARVAACTVPGLAMEMDRIERDAPLLTSDDAPLARWLTRRTGRSVGTVPFYTEGALFTELGATTVICGPGEIAQAHRVDEWVEFDALEAATQLYRDAIEEHCR